MSELLAVHVDPTPADIAGAGWTCCGVSSPFADLERALVSYAGWHAALPFPRCVTCGAPMAIVVAALVPRPKKPEPEQHNLTRTELRERRAAAKRAKEQLAAHPERTLMPFGDHVGKPMDDCPRVALEQVARYYGAGRRKHLTRSKELVSAAVAAIAARNERFDDNPLALFAEDDAATDDALTFTSE